MLIGFIYSVNMDLKITLKVGLDIITSLMEASDITGSEIRVNLIDFHDRLVVKNMPAIMLIQ